MPEIKSEMMNFLPPGWTILCPISAHLTDPHAKLYGDQACLYVANNKNELEETHYVSKY